MNDYSVAIERLDEQKREARKRYESEIAELDRAIAALRGLENKPGPRSASADAAVKPGQFSGMEISAAAQAYLNTRGAHGKRIPVDDVVKALQTGRAKMGQPDRQPRNVRIAFTHNPDLFDYSKDDDAVGLR